MSEQKMRHIVDARRKFYFPLSNCWFVFLCVGSKTHPYKYDIIKLAISNICMAVSGMLFVIHTRNFLLVHIQKFNNLRRYHQRKIVGCVISPQLEQFHL